MFDVTIAVAVGIPVAAAWHLGYLWLSEKRVSRQLRLNDTEVALAKAHEGMDLINTRLNECDVAFIAMSKQVQEEVAAMKSALLAAAINPKKTAVSLGR